MRLFKKENGHTLVEVILVTGLIGMLLLLLWTSYLSIHRTYIKSSKKAQNLEEARIVIDFITDSFQKYESKGCKLIISETGAELEDNEEGTVKEIIFGKDSENIKIKYSHINQKVTFQGVEVADQIQNFTVRRSGELLDFTIEAREKGNGVVPDQTIIVQTTVTMQYVEK